jgi:hypothetical protein
MAQPIPIGLGYQVTYRVLNWRPMVIELWGEEWGKNDIAYEMSNGIKKESTDRYQTGIYKRP